MPESMMMAEIGLSAKVAGKSNAIVAVGPIPGRTPTRVPMLTPTKQ